MENLQNQISELKKQLQAYKVMMEVNKSDFTRIINLANTLNRKLNTEKIGHSLLEIMNEILSFDVAYFAGIQTDNNGKLILEEFYTRIGNIELNEEKLLSKEEFCKYEMKYLEKVYLKKKYMIENCEDEGIKSRMILPLSYDERVSWVVFVGNHNKIYFSDEEAGIGMMIVSQAVTALQNAILFKEIDQKNKHLAEIQRKEALVNQAGEIAHEINSPLGGMLVSAQLIKDELEYLTEKNIDEIKENIKENAETIEKGAKKSKEIIAVLLKSLDIHYGYKGKK